MSHFTVLVVLPKDTELEKVQDKLEEVLEPWNENTAVEPRRSYEDRTPAHHWGYDSIRERMLTAAPDDNPAEMTWAQYVPLFNERWAHENASETLYVDEHTDRAYHMTTYNPASKWDWWSIGGRWANSLLAKPTVDVSALLVSGGHWTEQYGNEIPKGRAETGGIQCDGGRLMDMDLEGMQAMAVAKAAAQYDRFFAAIGADLLPQTKPWSFFFDLEKAGAYDDAVRETKAAEALVPGGDPDNVHPRRFAREAYRAQPGVAKLNELEEFRLMFECPIAKYELGRTEYIARAARNFLPGYAMVTLDGQWLASGEMGWFGMGSDEPGTVDAFKTEAKAYLRDQVDQESIVVLVDCHI